MEREIAKLKSAERDNFAAWNEQMKKMIDHIEGRDQVIDALDRQVTATCDLIRRLANGSPAPAPAPAGELIFIVIID